jgi:hypothetical protein
VIARMPGKTCSTTHLDLERIKFRRWLRINSKHIKQIRFVLEETARYNTLNRTALLEN